MASNTMKNVEKIIINTGNMMSLNDITKKPGQNPSEELIDAMKITIKEFQNGTGQPPEPDKVLFINRSNDDLLTKINENEISHLKIGLKIFLNSESESFLIEALEEAFRALNVDCVNDVIIAYNKQKEFEDDDEDDEEYLDEMKIIWKTLESYNKSGKIKQLGVADIQETTFKSLYDCTEIKPSIIQINLATCCVVSLTLQAFCKEKDVKLLTHSDPTDILPKSSTDVVLGKSFSLKWALRFLIHIKCRGVLTAKGYLLSLDGSH